MNSTDIAAHLFDSIDILVDKKLQEARFDKTIMARINKIINEVAGRYEVLYQDNKFEAIASGGGYYNVGDIVYVLLIQNDFSIEKRIIGKYQTRESMFVDQSMIVQTLKTGKDFHSAKALAYDSFKAVLDTISPQCTMQGTGALAIGKESSATGNYSTAFGRSCVASGSSTHAEGYKAQATQAYAHAEGSNTLASGWESHAEGSGTFASGASSHSEGKRDIDIIESLANNTIYSTGAIGNQSHTEGLNTNANGEQSHAEGRYTIAAGTASHAGGSYCHIGPDAANSFLHGQYLRTSQSNQFIIGQYNAQDTSAVFLIGWGSASGLKNILKVDANGNLYIAGTLTQNKPLN